MISKYFRTILTSSKRNATVTKRKPKDKTDHHLLCQRQQIQTLDGLQFDLKQGKQTE